MNEKRKLADYNYHSAVIRIPLVILAATDDLLYVGSEQDSLYYKSAVIYCNHSTIEKLTCSNWAV